MTFLLAENFIGGRKLPISEKLYSDLHVANRNIIGLLRIEQSFRIFIEAVRSFEIHLLRTTLDSVLGMDPMDEGMEQAYDHFDRQNAEVNHRLLSILMASGAYHDHRSGWTPELEGSSALRDAVSAIFSREFDNSLCYRAFECLRNHAKHRGLPVQTLTLGSSVEWSGGPGEGPTRVRNTLDPYILTSALVDNKKLRSATRDELSRLHEKLDCKSLVRSYVASMAGCHKELRRLTSPLCESARLQFQEALNTMSNAFTHSDSGPLKFLAVLREGEEEQKPVFADMLIFAKLERARHRFRKLDNYNKDYTSSAIVASRSVSFTGAEDVLKT